MRVESAHKRYKVYAYNTHSNNSNNALPSTIMRDQMSKSSGTRYDVCLTFYFDDIIRIILFLYYSVFCLSDVDVCVFRSVVLLSAFISGVLWTFIGRG